MKRVAVLTSGGDAPGMNAAVRAVVRTALARGAEPLGVIGGFRGLVDGAFRSLTARDVGGIIHQGGTILRTARCPEFRTEAGQRQAIDALRANAVDGVVVIGGNGSQTGALALATRGVRVVGIASTIDNDLPGSDITIGVDTALNVALEAIDRLKVTASSHQRAFLVEVMGRDCGYLALMAGIAGGAEVTLIPEVETDPERVAEEVRAAYHRGKAHALVVVAEGARHDADALAAYFADHRARLGFDLRVTRLGHVQRGGAPGAFDRILATRLGVAATERLLAGGDGVLAGMIGGDVHFTPLATVATAKKPLDLGLLDTARMLAQ
jgi:6-phosphofructokinase 1